LATFDAIFSPAPDSSATDINATSSSAEIVLGYNRIFAITASGDCHIAFGLESMGAADATDFPLWSNSYARYDTNKFDRIRVYNPGGSTITVYIQPLVH
jgi:hypothetical protein